MSEENPSKTEKLKSHFKKNWQKYLLGAGAVSNIVSTGLLWKNVIDNKKQNSET